VVLREAVDGYGYAQPRESIHREELESSAGTTRGEDVHGAGAARIGSIRGWRTNRLAPTREDVQGLGWRTRSRTIDKSLAAK